MPLGSDEPGDEVEVGLLVGLFLCIGKDETAPGLETGGGVLQAQGLEIGEGLKHKDEG